MPKIKERKFEIHSINSYSLTVVIFAAMKKIQILLFVLAFSAAQHTLAQQDSIPALSFQAYAELYYSYDGSNPANHEKPGFIYNHKRHNEVNLNLAMVKGAYNKDGLRGNLALMAGNYAQYNLAAEPEWARFVYEANVGVKISKKQNLWLDAGIMPSHIGFETAVGADCWNLTRSMVAENSPYYETGVKLSYSNQKENFSMALLALNGWQKVAKPDFIQRPSFGMQFTFKPTAALTLNYSNFIGTDKPDSLKALRTYHNLYAIYEPAGRVSLIAGVDVGTDKYNAKQYGTWYAPVLIIRYTSKNNCRIALRGEYFYDNKEIIVGTGTANGFQTAGLSANIDCPIHKKLLWRTEVKTFQSRDDIFTRNKTATGSNFSATTALCLRL